MVNICTRWQNNATNMGNHEQRNQQTEQSVRQLQISYTGFKGECFAYFSFICHLLYVCKLISLRRHFYCRQHSNYSRSDRWLWIINLSSTLWLHFDFFLLFKFHLNDSFSLIVNIGYVHIPISKLKPMWKQTNVCNWILNYVNEKLSSIGLHFVCIGL